MSTKQIFTRFQLWAHKSFVKRVPCPCMSVTCCQRQLLEVVRSSSCLPPSWLSGLPPSCLWSSPSSPVPSLPWSRHRRVSIHLSNVFIYFFLSKHPCNIGCISPETHFKFTPREISFAHRVFPSCPIVLRCLSDTVETCQNFKRFSIWIGCCGQNRFWDEFLVVSWNASRASDHDDVIKWKHFPRYCPFVRGIHRSPVDSPHKDQWRRALMFSLICTWTNNWANNQDSGDFRRHRTHYDATVMDEKQSTYLFSPCAINNNVKIIHGPELLLILIQINDLCIAMFILKANVPTCTSPEIFVPFKHNPVVFFWALTTYAPILLRKTVENGVHPYPPEIIWWIPILGGLYLTENSISCRNI